jgi:ribosomal protein L7/L12
MRRKGRLSAPPPPIAPIELPPELRAIVLRYRAEGRTVDAVKIVRERMGCDLRTARHLVDHVR